MTHRLNRALANLSAMRFLSARLTMRGFPAVLLASIAAGLIFPPQWGHVAVIAVVPRS